MHSCPNCGQACYCKGDIDAIECADSAADRCDHCDGDDFHEPTDDEIDAFIDEAERTSPTPEEEASLRRIDEMVEEGLGLPSGYLRGVQNS